MEYGKESKWNMYNDEWFFQPVLLVFLSEEDLRLCYGYVCDC
jgi:hypothetical protein